MKVTTEVITDLLPLYLAGEASRDTETLVKTYLKEHPQFVARVKKDSADALLASIPLAARPEDEMLVLSKTRRLLRFRTASLVVAVFFSLLPFAFGDVSWSEVEGVHWLWSNNPGGALASGVIGVIGWVAYLVLRKRLRTTQV